ncbi:hydroxysteroid dehydrogenase [Phaeosphaeria sp. MPI-PUGE-AT-0046c]|nr:hydroxysteroid dehydrogenase [Phaeosphaeria sp. MPI-PUGE-AT-0046c]
MAALDPVIVLGGCGSLGHHIVRKLFEAGATDVTVFDVNISANIVEKAKYIKGSIQNADEVYQLLTKLKPLTIFHTVSPSMLGQRIINQIFYNVNVNGTRTLLENIAKVGTTKALIYTGSSSVIHNNVSDLVFATEDAPYLPAAEQPVYYTQTKAEAEQIVLQANRKNGLLTAVIRGCTLFGEGDNVMPVQIGSAKAGRGKLQVGNGKNLYDWTYTGNCAYGHILAAQALLRIDPTKPPRPEDEDMRVDGEAFVISNDEPWPFWEFVRTVGATAGYPVKPEEIWVVPAWLFYGMAVLAEWGVWAASLGQAESKLNRQMVKYMGMERTFDISKAKKRLGYRPQVSVREGIERAVRDHLEKHPEDGKKGQ